MGMGRDCGLQGGGVGESNSAPPAAPLKSKSYDWSWRYYKHATPNGVSNGWLRWKEDEELKDDGLKDADFEKLMALDSNHGPPGAGTFTAP